MLDRIRKTLGNLSASAADGDSQPAAPRPLRRTDALLALAALWGIGLRLAEWWSNRSLWLDEILLANSIITRDFAGLLTGRLAHGQGAPGGFMLLTEAFTRLFGSSERVLRLPALLAGTAAVVCFALLARRWLSRGAAVVCTFVFAQADVLVYWSADFKPYSFDVLSVVLLALLASSRPGADDARSRRHAVLLAGAGLVLPWFSVASFFVLPGAAALLGVRAWRGRSQARWRTLGYVFAAWAVGGASSYAVVLSRIATKSTEAYWASGYIPHGFAEAVRWLFVHGARVLTECLSSTNPVVVLLVPLGLLGLWSGRRRPLALFTVPVVAAVLLASWLRRYAVIDRLALFLVPLLLLNLAAGLERLVRRRGDLVKAVVTGVGLVVLLGLPLTASIPSNKRMHRQPQLREFIASLDRRIEPGVPVCGDWYADAVFRLYAPALQARLNRSATCPDGLPAARTAVWVTRGYILSAQSVDEVAEGLIRKVEGKGWRITDRVVDDDSRAFALRFERSPPVPAAAGAVPRP